MSNNFSAEYGSYSTSNLNYTVNKRTENNDLSLSIQRFETDGFSATDKTSEDDGYQNSNINFSVVYNKFLNQDKETKKSISIIAPLGVDLNTQLALRFDGKEQINLRWSTCEQIGCLVFITNNSKNEKILEMYKKIYDLLNKSNGLEIAVKALAGNQPIAIQSNLNGFGAAAKKLNDD